MHPAAEEVWFTQFTAYSLIISGESTSYIAAVIKLKRAPR